MGGNDPVLTVVLTALAGCLGWGIRGVFGHQAGAMVPGALMGGAVALTCLPDSAPPHIALFLMAAGAAGISIGGVMTYGQTLGLVHGERRQETYWWGLLGCFLKGGLWFALGAVALGLALSGELSRPNTVLSMLLLLPWVTQAGREVLNQPFEPPHKYPRLYFSRRAAAGEDLTRDPPRRESWGGLLFGLLYLCGYVAFVLRAPRVWSWAAVGFLAGGIGFAVGEAIQAWGLQRKPFGPAAQPWVDWWKVMEMTFGLLAGAGVGLAMLLARPATEWPDPAQEGFGLMAAVFGAAWLLIVIGNAWGNRTASWLNDWPLLGAALLLVALSAAPRLAPAMVVGGFLLYISGADVLKRLRGQVTAARLDGVHGPLALVAIAWGLWDMTGVAPLTILVAVALTQTVLAFAKALAGTGRGSPRYRLRGLREAIPIQVSFLLLTALLWVLGRT